MKPKKFTPAHNSKELAELVCSNSLKSTSPDKASGILKKEMLQLDSLIINSAYSCQLPAGGALAVDRQKFSKEVSRKIKIKDLISFIISSLFVIITILNMLF